MHVLLLLVLVQVWPAAGKGCFLPHVEVSMADGQTKALQSIKVGDEVLSWDESTQQHAYSTVRGTPTFRRPASELVDIHLPHVHFRATVDHPFYSRRQRSLVAADPAGARAEYGLAALAFLEGEELEGLNGTGVAAAWRAAAEGRRLRESADVMTLCLEPHHWFYVHGVRVHNKGCFEPSAEVSLAGGGKRAIGQVKPGDRVLSWDEEAGRPAEAYVVAPRVFARPAEDLVELEMGHGTVRATVDHPFARGGGGLASVAPEQTLQEYGLEAEGLAPGARLLHQELGEVEVRALRRRNGSGLLQVVTLCLEPHHWFYVHGVRVHNKGGCFAPWTQVLLQDGSSRAIAEVKEGDRVASWDEELDVGVGAEVLALESFPPREMLELAAGNSTLVFTADHPIYSVRQRGVVSMRPDLTQANYGIAAGQMLEMELLQQAGGRSVAGAVRAYGGLLPPQVMTLRLAGSHWFYAEGLRVHNKGGYGSSGSSSMPTWRRRTYFPNNLAYAAFIASHSRRRRGTWQDGGCELGQTSTSADGGGSSGGMFVQSKCSAYMGGNTATCNQCNECEDQKCIGRIPGCAPFLASVYERCEESSDGSGVMGLAFAFMASVFGCIFCMGRKKQQEVAEALKTKREAREAMSGFNGPGLSSTSWQGQYRENGDCKPTSYQWAADSNGYIKGSTQDDDGTAIVTGVLNWPPGASSGQIFWKEEWTRGSNVVEAAGSIMSDGPSMRIEATYSSSLGVNGAVSLREAGQHALPVESGQRVPLLQ